MSSYDSGCVDDLFLECLQHPQIPSAPIKTPTITASRNIKTIDIDRTMFVRVFDEPVVVRVQT